MRILHILYIIFITFGYDFFFLHNICKMKLKNKNKSVILLHIFYMRKKRFSDKRLNPENMEGFSFQE